ncbi:MAG: hypothetical protein WC378_01090 [Opitutaceae bacterium]|jgi:hypothetical protein
MNSEVLFSGMSCVLVTLGGFFLPGYLLSELFATENRLPASFLGSCCTLFFISFALDLLGMPITFTTMAAGLAGVSAALLGAVAVHAKMRCVKSVKTSFGFSGSISATIGLVGLLPVLTALSAIGYRAWVEPLSGFDNPFRWDFLARQIYALKSMAFYPPSSAGDFIHYGWCDGIPPLIPILNLWGYFCFGETAIQISAIRVILEGCLFFWMIASIAFSLGGSIRSVIGALALASTSSVALWSIACGQETAMGAISLLAMVIFIEEHRSKPSSRAILWAGIAAGMGALAREYGLAWPVIGLLLLANSGGPVPWPRFLGSCTVVAMPWYLRNWAHTGNPIYCHSFFGLFPENPVHKSIMEGISSNFSVLGHPALILNIIPVILVGLGVAVSFGIWALISFTQRRKGGCWFPVSS